MAVRKRRSNATRRRTTTRARANPVRRVNRRRHTRRRRNSLVVARANPVRRYSRRRRSSNPSLGSVKGLFTGAVFVTGGVIFSQYAAGFIPVLPFGKWGVLAAKAGIAYGGGILAHRLGASQQNATLVTLGGLAGVVQDIFAIARSKFPDILQERAVQLPTPVQLPQQQAAAGMNDLVLWNRNKDYWGGSGMGDVVLYGRR